VRYTQKRYRMYDGDCKTVLCSDDFDVVERRFCTWKASGKECAVVDIALDKIVLDYDSRYEPRL